MATSKIIMEKVPHIKSKEFDLVDGGVVWYDTETTGIGEDDRIVQIGAAHQKSITDKKINTLNELCYTDQRSSSMAIATTNILPYMYADKPTFENSKPIQKFVKLMKNSVIIAHNIDFDNAMMEKEGISFSSNQCIDTLRVARHLLGSEHCTNDEKIESNQLQYLRYELELYKNEPAYEENYGITLSAHDAFSDVIFLRELFMYLYNLLEGTEEERIKEMILLTQTPVYKGEYPWNNPFPKGTPLTEIASATYEQWGKTKYGIDYLTYFLSKAKDADTYFSTQKVILDYKISELKERYEGMSNKDQLHLTKENIQEIIISQVYCTFDKKTQDFLNEVYLDSIGEKINKYIVSYFDKAISDASFNSTDTDDEKEAKVKLLTKLKLMYLC